MWKMYEISEQPWYPVDNCTSLYTNGSYINVSTPMLSTKQQSKLGTFKQWFIHNSLCTALIKIPLGHNKKGGVLNLGVIKLAFGVMKVSCS